MEINEVLLKTAFSCAACDGEIAPSEVEMVEKLSAEKKLFGSLDVKKEMQLMVDDINKDGKLFLKNYLKMLADNNFTEDDELKIMQMAVWTIQADNKIEYSEIKFFKTLRSNFKVDDDTILQKVDGIDEMYLQQDIKRDYWQLQEDYFRNIEIRDLKIE